MSKEDQNLHKSFLKLQPEPVFGWPLYFVINLGCEIWILKMLSTTFDYFPLHSWHSFFMKYMELSWSTLLQQQVHTVLSLDTVLLPSFQKLPVVHRETERKKKSPFLVTLSPCFLFVWTIYCRFCYTTKYDFNAIFNVSSLELQSLA